MHFLSLFCQVLSQKNKDGHFYFPLCALSEEKVHTAKSLSGFVSGVRMTSLLPPLEFMSIVLVIRRSILLVSKLNGLEQSPALLRNGLLEIGKLKSHDNFLLQTL